MCLILFSYSDRLDYKLILAANRDEFYHRPTAPLDFWEDARNVLGGRDLERKGTWLGVSGQGRLAAVTNYREPAAENAELSRGALISDYLTGSETPNVYLDRLCNNSALYGGFNLVLGDSSGMYHFSNRENVVRKLEPGLYGLSNRLLDTPWPKVVKGKETFSRILEKPEIDVEAVFTMLNDTTYPDDGELPDTGVGPEWERMLSPLFIKSPIYGTRSSSVVLIDRRDRIVFYERRYAPGTGEPLETRRMTIGMD